MNIYVGNLSAEVMEDELRQEFIAFGQVTSVSIIKDKYSGWSRGFAFVEMPVVSEWQAAVPGLKGKTLRDRTLNVSEVRPRSDKGVVVSTVIGKVTDSVVAEDEEDTKQAIVSNASHISGGM